MRPASSPASPTTPRTACPASAGPRATPTSLTRTTPTRHNNALARITYPDGTHRFFLYDPLGRLLESDADNFANAVSYSYTGAEGEISVSDAVGDTVSYFLDDREQTARLVDPNGNVFRASFDSHGNVVGLSLPQDLTATLQRNGIGDPTQATDPLGHTTSLTIGAFNAVTNLTTPDGSTYHNTINPTTGQLQSTAFPDGSTVGYTYFANGLVQTVTSRAGQAISNVYNADGTLQSQTVPGVGTYTYTYDAHKNLHTVTDPTGTTTYTHDPVTQLLTRVDYPGGQSLTYTYDPVSNRLTSIRDVASGYTVNYSYTALGQLFQLTDGRNKVLVAYTYDDAGHVTTTMLGNGTSTNYVYDAAGNVLSVTNLAADGHTVLSRFAYTYDSLNRPLTMTTAGSAVAGSPDPTTYGYDAAGQLVSVQLPGGRTIQYAYDANGNRTTVSDSAAGNTAYVSNNLDQYTSVGTAALTYDANGNLTFDGTNHFT
jgi:YD repeat-containing protein